MMRRKWCKYSKDFFWSISWKNVRARAKENLFKTLVALLLFYPLSLLCCVVYYLTLPFMKLNECAESWASFL